MTPQRIIALFAIAMAFLAWMAVKLPMPALPYLAHYFHTSAMTFKVSVSLNLLGFSLSQFIWGPLSERYGRRHILIVAFMTAVLGTVLAMLAINISMYILGRIIEGFAVGAAAPLGRAIMADTLDKPTMARVYAWYAIAGILPPAVGPVIGGYLFVLLGWRSIFAFFLILACLYLYALWRYFPETSSPKPKHRLIKDTAASFKLIILSSQFWRYVIFYAAINGFMITYYAAMPYWFVSHFHMGEDQYAWLAFFPIAAYILGSLVTNRLIKYFSFDQLLKAGIGYMLLIVFVLIIMAILSQPNIVNISILMSLFSVASGIITPMCNASLMEQFRQHVTALSALMSGIRVTGAGILVLVTTNIPLYSFWPLAIYTLCLSLIALLGYYLFNPL